VAARVKSSVLDENFCSFARVVNALGQPELSPAEIAVARAFCDQEKMRSELRYAVNVFCERCDALRLTAGDPSRSESSLTAHTPLRLCDSLHSLVRFFRYPAGFRNFIPKTCFHPLLLVND
jgi:hypothetical protein